MISKLNLFIIFLSISILNIQQIDAKTHHINLGKEEFTSTYDGEIITSDEVDGISEFNKTIRIREPGTYVLKGEFHGQVKVKLNDLTQSATLVLNGTKIICPFGPGIIFTGARRIDEHEYSEQDRMTFERAMKLNFTNVGARIVLADDSKNFINASHTEKHDGAIHSKVSIELTGEKKGNGELTVIADLEGFDSKRHILISGGIITIYSQDDAINASKDFCSAIIVNGGKLSLSGGHGSEGDGIDSNGVLVINGGDIVTSSKNKTSSGLDSEETVINGGNIISVGSSMDSAHEKSGQLTMNLQFVDPVEVSSVLTIKDLKGNKIVSFSPDTLGFWEGGIVRNFKGSVISNPKFELGRIYEMFIDGKKVGWTHDRFINPYDEQRQQERGNNFPGAFPGGFPAGGFPAGGFPGGFPEGGNQFPGGNWGWGSNRDNGNQRDKKSANYYRVNMDNGWVKDATDFLSEEEKEQIRQNELQRQKEVEKQNELKTDFIFTKTVMRFSGIKFVPN